MASSQLMFSVLFGGFCAVFLSLTGALANNIEPMYVALAQPVDKYVLPALPYGESDLEPYVDKATVQAHYRGHHKSYMDKLNTALAEWRQADTESQLKDKSILTILRSLSSVNSASVKSITNNGGGFVNHCFYFACLSPNPAAVARQPLGQLAVDIDAEYGSFPKFKESFNKLATNLFGSGYVWLCRDPKNNFSLTLTTTTNQISPISSGLHPLLVIDLWEHAYYLKHQYRRTSHVADWWMIVDWEAVGKLDQWWRSQAGHDEL